MRGCRPSTGASPKPHNIVCFKREFPKVGVPYFEVLIIRILLFRVPYFRKPLNPKPKSAQEGDGAHADGRGLST